MLLYPAYDTPKFRMIFSIVGQDSSRYHHMYSYLHDQTILDGLTQNEKYHLICNASQYVIIVDDIFRRGLDETLLGCLESEESKGTSIDVYEGICRSHSNGLTLAHKLIRAGNYWPNIEQEAIKYQVLQIVPALWESNSHSNQGANSIFHTMAIQQWAFDLVGQIHLSSSNGHKFIIIATNYFMKWVEAVPLSI